jgi:hypothetical protein
VAVSGRARWLVDVYDGAMPKILPTDKTNESKSTECRRTRNENEYLKRVHASTPT